MIEILIAIGAAIFAFVLGNWRGGTNATNKAETKARLERSEGYGNTRRKADDADIVGDDPAAAKRWLHERKPRQP